MSIETLTQMKFPPFVSFGLAKGITLPRTSQIFSTTFTFINLHPKSRSIKFQLFSGKIFVVLSMTIKCLSKLRGALEWKDFCHTFL